MRTTPRLLKMLPVLLTLLAVSCSYTPRMPADQETDYIKMLRAEFFRTHPDGQYNEHIKKGEVVRGMDFLEVLASWGNPDARSKPEEDVEHWTYLEVDEDSKDSVKYTFIFKKNALFDWDIERRFAQGSDLDTESDQDTDVLTKKNFVGGTEAVPIKKNR